MRWPLVVLAVPAALLGFAGLYLLVGLLYAFLLARIVANGPEPAGR